MESLATIGEFGLIEKLTKISNLRFPEGVVGPGDDCAVFAPGAIGNSSTEWQLVTTDTMVENRHFRLKYYLPEEIGWKVVATAVSDIAAMGGNPRAIVISLAMPKSTEICLLEGIYRGIRMAEEAYGVFVVGGDTVSATEISIAATVIGSSKQKPVFRSGAKVDEDIWVSGEIGAAYAGLILLEGLIDGSKLTVGEKNILERAQKCPEAQIDLGKTLSALGTVSSMIDVSDGLIQDLAHIVEESGVSAIVDITKAPLSSALNKLGMIPAQAITGGEDYSLLFTVPKTARKNIENIAENFKLTWIGETVKINEGLKGEVFIRNEGTLLTAKDYLARNAQTVSTGFSHF